MSIFSRSSSCVEKIAEDNRKMRKALDWSYEQENKMIKGINTATLLIENYLDTKDAKMLEGALESLSEFSTIKVK